MSQISIIILVAMIFLGAMAIGVGPHNGPRRAYRNRPDRRKLQELPPSLLGLMEYTAVIAGDFVNVTFSQPYVWDGTLPSAKASLDPGSASDWAKAATCEIGDENILVISFETGALEPGSGIVFDGAQTAVHGPNGERVDWTPRYCQAAP